MSVYSQRISASLLLIILTLFGDPISSQAINISDMATDGVTLADLQNALEGPGVSISNFSITNNGCSVNSAIGLFSQGASGTGPGPVLGDSEGVVLGTGQIKGTNPLASSNTDDRWDQPLCGFNVSDPDMTMLEPQTASGEYVAIEFDIVPNFPIMAIPFQFGSDEFPEYVCSAFNDAVGIFVSGPGINGPYSNSAENFAKNGRR